MTQTLSGVILDAKTNSPIESASVYFDNTTVGTTTNSKGEFFISYSETIQSGLVFSYLGYQIQTINDYRKNNTITIYLKPAYNVLDEIIIHAEDGLTREQKLSLFRKEFLGTSSFAKSCKILNEDDIVLSYNKKQKQLTANSLASLIIENKSLQYIISYDIERFEINFDHVEEKYDIFHIKSLSYFGKNFYRNSNNFNEKKASRNRKRAYQGSVLEFMRALYHKDLESQGFQIFFEGLKVNPWNHFKVESIENSKIKRVLLDKPVNILYRKKHESRIVFLNSDILVDMYGNYIDVTNVVFSGYMGNLRVGNLLPVDYGLE